MATPTRLELNEERQKFAKWYQDEKSAGTLKADEFKKRNDALTEMVTAVEQAEQVKSIEDQMAADNAPLERKVKGGIVNPGEGPAPADAKSLGELFTQSEQFKSFAGSQRAPGAVSDTLTVNVDKVYGKGRGFKTVLDTASSWSVFNVRLPEIITPGAQQPTVASLMPEGRTSGNAILYMQETTTTNAAAETAESGSKPEAALAFTQETSPVRKIAVSLPVTDESLEDVPFIETYIDGRLSFFVRYTEDSELLNGPGTGVTLTGFLHTSGINTQATGSDNNQDAILKGIVAAYNASYFDADAVILHPSNWMTMRLAKDDIGNYLFGPPNMQGADTVFGYRIVRTTAIAAGTGLAGAFQAGAQVFRRTDLAMSVGWVNDQFLKNQRTILVEERLALVVFRPSAFTKITGLA
ncbi:MAG TPA: phage major capsid protein [Gaiellaceae bacterium]|nr:phage major capsid protein [Gaiellaceae bacterium]